jgi:hypothetical protein
MHLDRLEETRLMESIGFSEWLMTATGSVGLHESIITRNIKTMEGNFFMMVDPPFSE